MKKILFISIFAFLLLIGVAGTFWGSDIAEAAAGIWNSCPRGEVNDPYPGDCRDYIDTNKDKICDRSQPQPKPAVATSVPQATVPVTSSVVTNPLLSATPTSTVNSIVDETPAGRKNTYNFIPVSLATAVLYCATWALSNRKRIKTLTHRKIWNVVLLVTMAGSALLGIVRILILDFNMNDFLPFNSLFWHVEISLVLGVVALFHAIWHWRYFMSLLKPKSA